jgi:hypothetical protein
MAQMIGSFFSWTAAARFGAITVLLGLESWALRRRSRSGRAATR